MLYDLLCTKSCTLMYKFSYVTGRTAHITATQCMLNLYSNVQKRNMCLVGDVRSDAHYGRYANGCKIVHWRFSDVESNREYSTLFFFSSGVGGVGGGTSQPKFSLLPAGQSCMSTPFPAEERRHSVQ